MTLKKLFVIFRSRWWALVIMGALGLIAGFLFATIRNDNIEPEFRSEAPVILVRQTDDDSGRELRGRLGEAQVGAIRANQDVLQSGIAEITTIEDDTEGKLIFIGFGPTAEAAQQKAIQMRSNYLDTAPVGVEAVQEDLETYANQVAEIREEITELQSQGQLDGAVEQTAHQLSAEIAQLQQTAVQLSVDLALYDFRELERERSDIEAELATVQEAISSLQGELEEIGPERSVDTERDLRIQALQQREAEITQKYLDLFLNQAEAAAITSEGIVETQAVGPEKVSPRLGAVGGFLLGLLIALATTLLWDFARKPIWSSDDIDVAPVLGTLSPRRLSAGRATSWYATAESGRRVADIQSIRASLEGVVDELPVVIGSARLGTSAKEHKAAVADLAASLAAVGRSVLLIDVDFGSASMFPEYDSGGPTVAQLLTMNGDDAVFRVVLKETLEELRPVTRGLWGISAGSVSHRPADVVSGLRFDIVLAEAREMADIVLVVATEAADPATLTVAQRVDDIFVVAKSRSTTIPHLETVTRALDTRRARFLGVVVLDRRREPIARLRPSGAHVKHS